MSKKRLPGKLNIKLAINVGALMPTSLMPPRKKKIHSSEAVSDSETLFLAYNMLQYNNLNLLNNEFIKSRARILNKRFPSTRHGRLANYHRSIKAGVKVESKDKTEENLPVEIAEIAAKPEERIKEKGRRNDKMMNTKEFEVGALVQLQSKAVRRGRSAKQGAQWLGPYVVLGKESEGAYKIKLGRKTKIVNSNELKSYFGKQRVQ